MATCILLVEKSKEIDSYIEETKHRMRWQIMSHTNQLQVWDESETKQYILATLSPFTFINPLVLALIGSAIAISMFGVGFFYYLSLIVGCAYYFTTNGFLAMVTEKAIRKKMYAGTIIKITEQDKIIELLLARKNQ